ncbi:hypothetical protein RHSIM_Rhsim01G0152400 [Rhododendron simsii]|uniref:Uncharacterized protein n=1 Tax=Rhododendron simsii TaxID=118357 RepID=A0A834HGJ7_RHOSS|nr:hypothetical protein RHSIM_Rhsim01G0152400 [Rhododendron simsii]
MWTLMTQGSSYRYEVEVGMASAEFRRIFVSLRNSGPGGTFQHCSIPCPRLLGGVFVRGRPEGGHNPRLQQGHFNHPLPKLPRLNRAFAESVFARSAKGAAISAIAGMKRRR